jgi:hypothetical protein
MGLSTLQLRIAFLECRPTSLRKVSAFRISKTHDGDSGNCHCRAGQSSHMMNTNELICRCDSCDTCIALFLHHLQLGDIVDIAALVRDCILRDAIVQFHRNGIQYVAL